MSNEIDKLSWKASGEANEYSLMRDGNWMAMIRMNGEMTVPQQEWVIRRIVACANACAGIATDALEGKTIQEYVASEAFITGMTIHDGMSVGLKGLAVQMLAEQFAGQFVGNGAINFLEVGMVSEKTGPLVVTIQRVNGKTPAQLKKDAEHQRDELLTAARNLRKAKGRYHSEQAYNTLMEVVAKVESANA